ncbi:MAG: copper homeostasis protein CutC [Cellulophaga sp.]|nr:copper homeostasis protein CutC [Cellulophaga sp.]
MLVEVCANSLESALNAQNAGADRIELCLELGLGGITPSFGLLKLIKEKITIPVHVLIRPRSGDFTYDDLEFETMLHDIQLCVELGFEGIVSGALHADLKLDIERTTKLSLASKDLNFTFHRAFDWVKDPFLVLNQLEKIGVDYILTSGQQLKAIDGLELLTQLHQKAKTCTIMPGSGINADNARLFKEKGFKVIHLSGTTFYPKNANLSRLPMSTLSFFQEDKKIISDIKILKDVVNRVK